jgi:hypothetical protein
VTVACRDRYRASREAAIALGLEQSYLTSEQLGQYMPDDITDLQMYRWLSALRAHGIRLVSHNEEIPCAR